ncbi:MAG: DUF4129 domain-containing protein [Thermoplasmata archaeon]
MAAPLPSGRRRGPPAAAWILLLAVLVGVAAAFLSRPVGPVSPSTPVLWTLTLNQLSELFLILVLVGVGFWLFYTLRNVSGRAPIPGQVIATILVVVLLGVLFVEFAGLVHVAPAQPPTNSTGQSNPPGGLGNGGLGNNTTTIFGTPGITLPAWAGVAAIVGVAILAGALLVPYMLARAEDRRRARSVAEGPTQEAQKVLQEALERLKSTDGTDARAAILALYARLLLLVGPRLGTVESLTPGEIQRESIASLGLRPRVAQDLTETFEEARYSTHPMTAEAVDRARAALAEAISDLAQSAGVPA